MAKRRVVTHLTVEEYTAALKREAAASNSPFIYNTKTETLKVDIPKLERMVDAAKKSPKVCRDSERVFTVADLN